MMRYRPSEDVTTDMVLLKTDDGTAIRYQVGASAGAPGWYFVADDWSTPSSTPTRNLIVAAPAAWFSVAFTRPRYVSMIPTDLYYGSIVNPSLYGQPGHHDWDLDGNGYYGFDAGGNPDGFDLNADLSVGRVPVRTAAQANAWIDKLISYETFHDVGTGVELPGDFPQRLVAVGAVWGSNWSDDSTQRLRWGDMDGASADKDKTIATLLNAGVHVDRVRRFLADGYFAQNRCDLVEMTDARIPQLRDAMNWGPAYVTVSGHGWWDGCSWLSSEYPTSVNVDGMTNGMRGGVWFVDSCWTNEIDHHLFPPDASRDTEPCLGKHLISRSGGGAVAYLGCTRECEVGSSQEQVFWDGMLYPWLRRIGPMADRTRVIGRGAVGAYEVWLLTLLGDPEMKLRTRTPDTFNVSFPAVVYGQDQLTVEVFRQDAPVLDWELQVAVTADGADPQNPTVFTLAARDGNRFTFDTRGAADGQLNICVTAPDAVPLVCYATKVSTPISDAARHVSGVLTGGVVSAVTMAGAHLVAGTSDGLVAALDPTTLATRWSYSMTGEVLGLISAADGSVLAGARAAAGANLVLLDVTGSPTRSWSTGHNVYALARDPARGMVYAGMDGVGLVAYRTSDGAQVFTGAGSTCIGLAVAPDGRVLATGGDSTGHRVYCYHSDGSLAWSYRVGDGSDGGWAMSLAVNADGTCWVGSRDNNLYRIDATGSGAAVSSVSLHAPAITLLGDGSTVAVGCGDGQVLRLDNNGSPLWSNDVGERVESLVIYGGYTYAGSWTKVTALTGTGEPAWSRVTNATVLGEAATGNLLVGGHLFAGTRDGWVYRIMLSPGLVWYPGTVAAVASAQALAATNRVKLDVAALNHYLAGHPVIPIPGPPPPGPRPVAVLG
jgi:outer membrane protein assembly factor BamB